jgi:hypothetical protein
MRKTMSTAVPRPPGELIKGMPQTTARRLFMPIADVEQNY